MPEIKYRIKKAIFDPTIHFLTDNISDLEIEHSEINEKLVAMKVYIKGTRLLEEFEDTFEDYRKSKSLSDDDISREYFKWTDKSMPVMNRLSEVYKREKTFDGKTILLNTHLKENTGILAYALRDGSAEVIIVPVPYSGDRAVYKRLIADGIKIYGRARMEMEEMNEAISKALNENKIDLIIEDGFWITKHIIDNGLKINAMSVEQTKAGINLAKDFQKGEKLPYPVITVGNAELKESIESSSATPESILNNIVQVANWSILGKTITIVGFGPVGSGIAKIARAHNANVVIVEKDPMRILAAMNNGFPVEDLSSAIMNSDILITATGKPNVVSKDSLLLAKEGILLVNGGSKNYEINVNGLKEISAEIKPLMRDGIKEYVIKDLQGKEKSIYLVADGYPINLAFGEGTPSDTIDITLSLLSEVAKYLITSIDEYDSRVYPTPIEVQEKIVNYKLEELGKCEAITLEPFYRNIADFKSLRTEDSLINMIMSPNNSGIKNFGVTALEISPREKVGPHYHIAVEEAYYVIDGKGIIKINDREFNLKPGDIVGIPKRSVHILENNGDRNIKIVVITSPSNIHQDSHIVKED